MQSTKRVMDFFVGGGAATVVQGGTAVLRLGSTGTTGNVSAVKEKL